MLDKTIPEAERKRLFSTLYNSIAARLETGSAEGAQEKVWECNIVILEKFPQDVRDDGLTLLQEVIAEVNQDYMHDSPDRDMSLDKSRLLFKPLRMKVH